MATMKMDHAVDPREEILSKLRADLDSVQVYNNQILLAVYIRPAKTASGIIIPDETRAEDRFQGKVGLVVKKGPLAFQDDKHVDFHGQDINVGDWAVIRASDGWQLKINGILCRLVDDQDIRLRVDAPDTVY